VLTPPDIRTAADDGLLTASEIVTLSLNADWVVLSACNTAARVGIVSIGGPTAHMTGPLPPNRTVRAFLRGMAELGYVYGRDFVTEPRGTDGIAAVAELVSLQVDVIVATGGGSVLSLLKQATTTIPIVRNDRIASTHCCKCLGLLVALTLSTCQLAMLMGVHSGMPDIRIPSIMCCL